MSAPLDRRRFLQKSALLGFAAAAGISISADQPRPPQENDPWPAIPDLDGDNFQPTTPYPDHMPNVILIRFGGGVRRLETILDSANTWCPFIYHELFQKSGVLFPKVEIDSLLETDRIFTDLLGKDSTQRHRFVMDKAAEVDLEEVDV